MRNLSPIQQDAIARGRLRFVKILELLMLNGIRPLGHSEQGTQWTTTTLAAALNIDERAVRYWCAGETAPSRVETIEKIFFGNASEDVGFPDRVEWRAELREAHKSARERKIRVGRISEPELGSEEASEPPSGVEGDANEKRAPTVAQQKRRQESNVSNFGVSRFAQRYTEMFFSEYIDAEAGIIPFGGRDKELSRLDNWLLDSERPRRMLLAGPAGRGKSALLVQWIKSLQERHLVNNEDQWLAFMPISIRSGTNRPDIFWPGLAYRLSEITGRAISLEATRTSDGFKYEVVDQLGVIGEANLSVLVILDGLDEALYGSFEFAIARETLRPNIRIIMSARWQVGDTNSEGWLKRLRWDRNVRYEVVNLDRLSVDDIDDVLKNSDLPSDSLVEENAIASRLAVLTDGDPILVRYYAQDLWGLGQWRARIAISDLDNLKPGFYNYLDYWLSYQERLWADEGTVLDRNEIDRVLSIMAFAHGPLTSRDLIELLREIHQIDGLLSQESPHFIVDSIRP